MLIVEKINIETILRSNREIMYREIYNLLSKDRQDIIYSNERNLLNLKKMVVLEVYEKEKTVEI